MPTSLYHQVGRIHLTIDEFGRLPSSNLKRRGGLRMTGVGTERAFVALLQRHRRELHVHCYRMLGSFEEAEDLVQETFLRAWRSRDSVRGEAGARAWLYRIATNACLDALRGSGRRLSSMSSFAEVPWLQPYPDRLLDQVAPSADEPEAAAVARETVELGYLALIQLLPPRQRAVLILRDVLVWSATETAELLETSVPAVNSALQRARATLEERVGSLRWSVVDATAQENALLRRYMAVHEQFDVATWAQLLRNDVRVTMPPEPLCYDGRDTLWPLLERALAMGDWRLVPTRANRQPAAACYLRRPGDTEYRAYKLDVLRVGDGLIAEITTFGARLFPEFGLPPTI
jgi:RNA polymerase sigma-70 factor (ECF subfamily)